MLTIDNFVKNATRKQVRILRKLESFAKQEEKFERKINNIYKNASFSESIFLLLQHFYYAGAETLSSEDENPYLKELKSKLCDIRSKIKKCLVRAAKTGMKDLDIVQINYKQYVGKSLEY